MININKWRLLMQQAANGGGVVAGPIELVTTGFQTSTSSTQQMTITGIQSGDFIIVSRAADTYVSNDPPNMTLGHTTGTSYTNVRAGWYYAFSSGTSFTTTVDGDPSGNSYRVIWVYSVWRNVDQSNPINTWGFSYSGSNGVPNPPSITTTSDGCMIVPMMMLDDDDVQDVTAPSGYDLAISAATRDTYLTSSGATNAHAYLLQSSAGSIDPGTFGRTSGTLDDQWAAYTVALNQASGSGGGGGGGGTAPTQISEIPSLTYWFNPDTIDANATADGDNVTEWVCAVTGKSAPSHPSNSVDPKMRVVNGVKCVSFNESGNDTCLQLTESNFTGLTRSGFVDEGEIVFKYESANLSGYSATNWKMVWSKYNSSSSAWEHGCDHYGTGVEFALGNTSLTFTSGSYSFTAGDIVCASWTTSGGTTTLTYYKNGNVIGSGTVGNTTTSVEMTLGGVVTQSNHGFIGAMSHFIMFDAPLTSAERTIVLNEI